MISRLMGPTTLNDGQVAPLTFLSLDSTANKSLILEYSVERNGENRTGQMLISNNTSNVGFDDAFVETSVLGITFSAVIATTNIEVQYVTTATGFTGAIKYSLRRWTQ